MISNIGQRKDERKVKNICADDQETVTPGPESQRIIQVIPSYVDATDNQTLQIGKDSKWIEPPPIATITQTADGEYMLSGNIVQDTDAQDKTRLMLARRLRKKIRVRIKMRKTDQNKTVEIVLERGIIGLQIVQLLFKKR